MQELLLNETNSKLHSSSEFVHYEMSVNCYAVFMS